MSISMEQLKQIEEQIGRAGIDCQLFGEYDLGMAMQVCR